jgi:hypothetical protein
VKKKRKPFSPLTAKRRIILRELAKGKTMGEAGRIAGYAQPNNANRAMSVLRPQIIEAMAKYGWDIDRFAKHQAELLEAKKTLFFQHEGYVTDKRTVKDNATQLAAQDQCYKILGVYAPVSVEHSGVVEHVLTEREKLEAEASIKTLLLCEKSDAEDALEGEFDDESK